MRAEWGGEGGGCNPWLGFCCVTIFRVVYFPHTNQSSIASTYPEPKKNTVKISPSLSPRIPPYIINIPIKRQLHEPALSSRTPRSKYQPFSSPHVPLYIVNIQSICPVTFGNLLRRICFRFTSLEDARLHISVLTQVEDELRGILIRSLFSLTYL